MAGDKAVEQHCNNVIALSKPGRPLAPDAARATVNNPEWFAQSGPAKGRPKSPRRKFHHRLLEQHRESTPDVRGDRRAVVLAGPPGAGKSTILCEILGADLGHYLVIDPDDFKRLLLQQSQEDGSYETWIKPEEVQDWEANGEQFFPLELASLMHEESSLLAKTQREWAIGQGVNIVVDTVLSSESKALKLGEQLTEAGYRIEVVDVEVSYEISKARIARRWRQAYKAALEGRDEWGGRWVPSEFVREVFTEHTNRSKPEAVAAILANSCQAVDRYRVYRTTAETIATATITGGWEKDMIRTEPGGPLLPGSETNS